jgi:hypothetical protein
MNNLNEKKTLLNEDAYIVFLLDILKEVNYYKFSLTLSIYFLKNLKKIYLIKS